MQMKIKGRCDVGNSPHVPSLDYQENSDCYSTQIAVGTSWLSVIEKSLLSIVSEYEKWRLRRLGTVGASVSELDWAANYIREIR